MDGGKQVICREIPSKQYHYKYRYTRERGVPGMYCMFKQEREMESREEDRIKRKSPEREKDL